ncbi:MAG: hypothetical protein BWY11_00804 [Firmicutes bacterium ADurb.Bin182]|nr:MAG: hypothetical protein BWY11_00804 [Firmicutes bacterium ADurb.Bin182]
MGVAADSLCINQACINALNRCAQGCLECFAKCLDEDEARNRTDLIKVLCDCSKICQLASMLLMENSKFSKQFCEFCADILESCALSCSRFEDKYCVKCAEECNICAIECRSL